MGELTIGDLCERLSASGLPTHFEGNAQLRIHAVNTLEEAGPGELSFLANPKYTDRLATTKASAVLIDRQASVPDGVTGLRCDDPYAALCHAIVAIHGYRKHPQWGISEQAFIAPSATVGRNANIAPFASISNGARIGANVTLYPGAYVGDRSVLGDGVTLFPNAVVYDDCVLGNRVTIHAGTVIGEDGLGYAPVGNSWVKIPQVGRVVIGDDVEIGSNCSVDRATLGSSEISRGTKFSNLIAIGHGTKIGEDCLLVAQVGIAGSTTVGNHVTIAGQAGIVGHHTIGDNARVGAQAGVRSDVDPGATVLGSPAVPINEAKRQLLLVERLPEMRKELKALRAELDRLRKKLEQ